MKRKGPSGPFFFCQTGHSQPPSITKFCDVHMALSSDARNSTRRATASGWMRSGGTAARRRSVRRSRRTELELTLGHDPAGEHGVHAERCGPRSRAKERRQRFDRASTQCSRHPAHADPPGYRTEIDDRAPPARSCPAQRRDGKELRLQVHREPALKALRRLALQSGAYRWRRC